MIGVAFDKVRRHSLLMIHLGFAGSRSVFFPKCAFINVVTFTVRQKAVGNCDGSLPGHGRYFSCADGYGLVVGHKSLHVRVALDLTEGRGGTPCV